MKKTVKECNINSFYISGARVPYDIVANMLVAILQ